ncbi:MAG: hypothetical protein KHX14_07645 [[Clostridium] spiroforme]|uniref:Uncharacterized protein n=1 Tax=Thomasclavelia spiroformis TaxID=29348 RepID=A0A943I813_9FIRM|nr:hypothetical protein [Thomasclavelia spiroformis]MBS5588671.1 hypothetical protein [Thomasclavelia spiroformis]
MSRFERKVERQKKEFEFTKKVEPPKTKFQLFKENFGFRWMKINIKSTIILMLDFILVSIIFIPLLMNIVGARMAFVLGHGIITSFLVVITFKLINKEKTVFWQLLGRYCFMVILLSITSFIAGLLV